MAKHVAQLTMTATHPFLSVTVKRRGIRSPDEGDALALTFASSVASPEPAVDRYAEAYRRQRRRSYSAWSA